MCDTLVSILPDRVLFAKNSDRNPNEGQSLDWQPRRSYARGAQLKCTWIEIPQASETAAVLLSRPFWMWGAEIGANEHGVVIGNEAVYTKEPYAAAGLTGMDLLRLALERSSDAAAALDEILRLLHDHGQGGGCSLEDRAFVYHNSFLIADHRLAFVLETAGKKWAWEEVRGSRSISNGLTIPDFASRYSDAIQARLTRCSVRQGITGKMAAQAGSAGDFMKILRDHGPGELPRYAKDSGALGGPCVHAGGAKKSAQTTASWVAELKPDGAKHWVTATAAPCLGIFKPVRIEEPLALGPEPSDVFDDRSLFWRHEAMHRMVMRDYGQLAPAIQTERDRVERGWRENPPEPVDAFRIADEMLVRWTAEAMLRRPGDKRPVFAREYWRTRDAWALGEKG
jgi:dipeptidase